MALTARHVPRAPGATGEGALVVLVEVEEPLLGALIIDASKLTSGASDRTCASNPAQEVGADGKGGSADTRRPSINPLASTLMASPKRAVPETMSATRAVGVVPALVPFSPAHQAK
jgi:hypothetical protein